MHRFFLLHPTKRHIFIIIMIIIIIIIISSSSSSSSIDRDEPIQWRRLIAVT